MDAELYAAGLSSSPTPRKKSGRWVLLLLILALLSGGGGYGYYWYRTYKFVQGEWGKARAALLLGTPGGYASVIKAAQRILEKRAKSAKARAAIGMCEAALSIEFGLDRRTQAKKALDATKGQDSEWRTAAQGFLALIDDPASAVGYLQKGIEVFPESPLLLYLKGRALVSTGKGQAGVNAFQAALKQAPAMVSAKLALASLVGRQDKGYDQAAQMFDEVLKGYPGHIEALVGRARLRARHEKELDGAISDMRRIATDLKAKAGRGQIGWAQLVLSQLYRRRAEVAAMSEALDAAIASPPCCDSFFRYELAGELIGLFRLRDAYRQMLAALALNQREPRYLQRAGRLLLSMDRPSKAAKYINAAPAGQPETKVLTARLEYARGRYEDAAGALKPLLTEANVAEEATLFHALSLARLKRTKAAYAALAALAKAKPTLDTVPQFVGRIALWKRNYKKAENALKKAWGINKLDPNTPTLLGHVSLAIHAIDRAVKRYNRALKSRPDFAPARIALADLLRQIGSLAEARKQLAKVAEPDRDLRIYRVAMARIELAAGRIEAAENAIKLVADDGAPALLTMRLSGELALAKKQGKTALPLLKKAHKADPKDAELLVLLGQAQLLAGKVDDSYDTLHAVLKLDPGQPVALLKLGRIAIRDGEHNLAVKRLKEALKQMRARKRPKKMQAAAFTALGLAFLSKRDTGRAIGNLQDAMDLDPNSAEARYHMGVTYDKLDRPQRAVGYYQKAISLDKTYGKAYLRLGKALGNLGQSAKAIKMLTAYLEGSPKAKNSSAVRREIRRLQKTADGR